MNSPSLRAQPRTVHSNNFQGNGVVISLEWPNYRQLSLITTHFWSIALPLASAQHSRSLRRLISGPAPSGFQSQEAELVYSSCVSRKQKRSICMDYVSQCFFKGGKYGLPRGEIYVECAFGRNFNPLPYGTRCS